MNLNEPLFVTELSVTSVQVSEENSTICAEGSAGKYGKVFVTYVLDSAGDRSGGTYHGSVRTFPDGDSMISAALRGIWRREGAKVQIFSLDHASNGDQNFAVIELDILAKQVSASVFSLN